MNKYIEAIKNMFSKEKDSKVKTQNFIFLVILLVFSLIVINNVFSKDVKKMVSNSSKDGQKNQKNSNNSESTNYNDIENKLKNTLASISGVSDVSVMITYSSENKRIPIYDVKEDTTIEETSDGTDSKTTKKTTTEKNVAYEESNGEKVAIIESNELGTAIGAIIVANYNGEIRLENKIKEAVSSALDIPVHKVQVFER